MINTKIIILFLFVFTKIGSLDDCEGSATDKNECFNLETEEDKDLGTHCCIRTTIDSNVRYKYECELLYEDDYNDLSYYSESEGEKIGGKVTFDCHQSYLLGYNSLSLFILNLIIFIII